MSSACFEKQKFDLLKQILRFEWFMNRKRQCACLETITINSVCQTFDQFWWIEKATCWDIFFFLCLVVCKNEEEEKEKEAKEFEFRSCLCQLKQNATGNHDNKQQQRKEK